MTQEATQEDPAGDLQERICEQVLYAASQPITRRMDFPADGYSAHFLREINDNPKAEIINDDCGEPSHYILTLDRGKKRDTFYICVDMVERAYGGPEEGGWYYDSGTVMTYEAVRVHYDEGKKPRKISGSEPGGKPQISDLELIYILTISQEWIEEFGGFDSNYRSSVRPRGDDYRIRVTYDEPEDWNSFQPYC